MKSSRPLVPPKIQVWLLVAALSLLWGSSFLVLKRVLYLYNPVQVFAGRMLFATIFIVPLAWKGLKRIPSNKWPPLMAVAIIANFTITLLNAFAQISLTSALAGILNSLTPLATLVIGVIFFGGRLAGRQTLGILMGLLGTSLLVWSSSDGHMGGIDFFALLVVGATILHGFTNHIIRANLGGLDHLQVAGASFVLIAPLAILAGFTSGFFEMVFFQDDTWQPTLYLAFLGIGSNALALLMIARLVQLSSPLTASLVNYFIPIVAVGWGLYDGEHVSLLQIAMMGVIILSVWVINQRKRTADPEDLASQDHQADEEESEVVRDDSTTGLGGP